MDELNYATLAHSIHANPRNPEEALDDIERFSDFVKDRILWWYNQITRVLHANEVAHFIELREQVMGRRVKADDKLFWCSDQLGRTLDALYYKAMDLPHSGTPEETLKPRSRRFRNYKKTPERIAAEKARAE